ncbi:MULTISPECIES: I78 family peptidase inhibitor [unclassified Paracoccus (in: a-proteobacteria)]|uniref:I78 family peptidase inhibitor n=1 Tax=unclassified Paracoccus (in: a-proteobacteria) TaxID=2688777 RepID=UPI0012B1F44F|nr:MULTISPECIES: I78 family peptidase inhibitor [unclassified Paracoccus (in: a-proteobacteria)]UXU75894.1 I78 family peptidase inhibitor [Paracoccus sp. SMMA_5]UXU81804.1 I78 family peptidase inhibitor [Paracoccus sp. SMMA_5_TC]
MNRLALMLPLLLAACLETEVPQPAPQPEADACRAGEFKVLVGQPRLVLRDMQLPQGTRIIGPRDAVTMDYRQDRLNFEIGADGRIAKVACY